MSLLIKTILLVGTLSLFANAQSADSTVAKSNETVSAKTKEMDLDTVNVGNDDFFTPFLWEGTDDYSSDDQIVKENIDSRDFASDEFYMRNIDREEFEQERILMLFRKNKKKKGFKTWTRSGLASKISIPGLDDSDEEEDKEKKQKP